MNSPKMSNTSTAKFALLLVADAAVVRKPPAPAVVAESCEDPVRDVERRVLQALVGELGERPSREEIERAVPHLFLACTPDELGPILDDVGLDLRDLAAALLGFTSV